MKTKYVLASSILIARIAILFVSDASFNRKNTKIEAIDKPANETQEISGWNNKLIETNKEKITKSVADLDALTKIYEKTKSEDVLKQLIEKEAQNYQFNEAFENIKKLKNPEEDINPQLYLYIAINSSIVKISDPESMGNIMNIVNNYKENNLIDNDDDAFYEGLKEIWNGNYETAIKRRWSIEKDIYKISIEGFKEAILNNQDEKSLPEEYKDGLVALSALKNWYFNIARKIAVKAINKNDKYILPYQILAYSHFLSNNRDVAIEYFIKLTNFDNANKDMYKFLIWAAYYRKWDYSSSIIYLTQVENTNIWDTLRYLIQDYLHLDMPEKMKQARSYLINQKDISPSDFSLYFYSILYKSYFTMDIKTVEEYKDLSTVFIEKCNKIFTGNDVCLYGELGKAALENSIENNESKFIELTERYNISYLYHILWDYFTKRNETTKAKTAYGKATALSEDVNEKFMLKQKLEQITP